MLQNDAVLFPRRTYFTHEVPEIVSATRDLKCHFPTTLVHFR